jgi:hypothetical protein
VARDVRPARALIAAEAAFKQLRDARLHPVRPVAKAEPL